MFTFLQVFICMHLSIYPYRYIDTISKVLYIANFQAVFMLRVHEINESVSVCVLCLAEVMSEMAGRHVEAIGTWSCAERGRCVQMVVVSPWLLRVT